MVGSARGLDEANPGFGLATQTGKMGLPALFLQKRHSLVLSFGHIINPLLTKLFRLRWLDISLVLFCVSIENKIRELGQYPAILIARLVNNAYCNHYRIRTLRRISILGYTCGWNITRTVHSTNCFGRKLSGKP